jgi:ribosomal protein L11 methyltransferase
LAGEFSGLLAATDSLGMETIDLPGAGTEVRVFFNEHEQAVELRSELAGLFERFGLDPDEVAVSIDVVKDGRWVEKYQEGLKPLALGGRFVVFPSKPEPGYEDREPIMLVPGRAFGTGEHQTTSLCAEGLEKSVGEGQAWLDLGTGTGILAVVAARCGAGRVLALDNDPDAVEVAREVTEANGVGSTVTVSLGTAPGPEPGGMDGVVANISAVYLGPNMKNLAAALRPGGILLLSGITTDDLEEIGAAVKDAGCTVIGTETRDEWAMITARAGGRHEDS